MIVGVGDNCIDYYLPPVDLKTVGGNIVNVIVNLQKKNLSTAYIGTVGTDEQGEYIISKLSDLGIDTSFISKMSGPTGITEIYLKDGEYYIQSEEYGVSNNVKITKETLAFLNQHASHIHLSLTGKASQLIQSLSELDVPISCDISTFYRQHDKEYWNCLFPYLDYVFVSGGTSSPEECRKIINEITEYGISCVVVTRGANGCLAYSNGKETHQKSLVNAEELVDPLGAGDAFISGFLESTLNKENTMEDHLLNGSKCAAEACKHFGAW